MYINIYNNINYVICLYDILNINVNKNTNPNDILMLYFITIINRI